MFFKKLNNAELWSKIQELRELIKIESQFKQRICWKCKKELNIYDFLSDNLEYDAVGIMKFWQNPMLEFHCCECFKELKIDEITRIERDLKFRNCGFCNKSIELYRYAKANNYLKIQELKEIWLNLEAPIFCDKICNRKYLKLHYNTLKLNSEP